MLAHSDTTQSTSMASEMYVNEDRTLTVSAGWESTRFLTLEFRARLAVAKGVREDGAYLGLVGIATRG